MREAISAELLKGLLMNELYFHTQTCIYPHLHWVSFSFSASHPPLMSALGKNISLYSTKGFFWALTHQLTGNVCVYRENGEVIVIVLPCEPEWINGVNESGVSLGGRVSLQCFQRVGAGYSLNLPDLAMNNTAALWVLSALQQLLLQAGFNWLSEYCVDCWVGLS